jgi:hypothetical protein
LEGTRASGYTKGMAERAPDCLKCLYFRVTWDPRLPRACDVFGIRCRQMPSAEVFAATGHQCPAFSLKPGLK